MIEKSPSMSEDEYIAQILELLTSDRHWDLRSHANTLGVENFGYVQTIRDRMEYEGIVERVSKDPLLIKITQPGRDIVQSGGWLKHLERLKAKAQKQLEYEQYDFERVKYEADLAKKNVRYFKVVIFCAVVGALGGIAGIVSLLQTMQN